MIHIFIFSLISPFCWGAGAEDLGNPSIDPNFTNHIPIVSPSIPALVPRSRRCVTAPPLFIREPLNTEEKLIIEQEAFDAVRHNLHLRLRDIEAITETLKDTNS